MPVVGEIKTNPNNPAQSARWDGRQWVDASASAGPKSAPSDWPSGSIVLPNMDVLGPPGPRGGARQKLGTIQPGGGTAMPDIKEFQAAAAARATLMDQGLADYRAARASGYDPGAPRNMLARGLEGSGIGNWAADVVRDKPSERGRAAELQFVDGALRTTSGANAPEPEVVRANRAYFRQPGESAGVEPNKDELRRRFRDQAVRISGAAYIPPQTATGPKIAVPPAARAAYDARVKGGRINTSKPRGDAANPFLAVDMATANRLPKGSHVILPDGSLGVVE